MHFTISEKLALLALDDEKGTVVGDAQTALSYALAGGVIMELARNGFLEAEGDRISAKATDSEPANQVARMVYQEIKKQKKPRKMQSLLTNLVGFSSFKKEKDLILDSLVQKGVLRKDQKTWFWVFKSDIFPEANARPEEQLRLRLREVLLEYAGPDYDEVVVIALANACKLHKELFPDKEEREVAKARMKDITENNIFGQAVNKAVQDIETAIMVTLMAATTVVVSS